MSTDSGGGAPKKLTTAEILAKARAEKAAKAAAEAGAAAPVETPAEAPAAPVEAAAAPEAAAPAAPAAAAATGSTADKLAAARAAAAAKKAGGAAAPAAPAATPAPAAGAATKPKSTADILAAARAAKAGAAGDAATPAASSAAAPSAAKPVVAAGGPKPSVQEMLAAVRGGQAGVAAAAAPVTATKVAAPPMPVKPQPPAPKKAATAGTRRNFLSAALAVCLSPFWVAWASFAAATAASTLATLRFMLPNVLTEPPSKFKVGSPGDFDLGTVSEKFKAQFGIWIVHTDKYQGKNLIYALSTVCTHLGCTPSWLDGEQKYKCPCHGSGFYIHGINFEGPAPRPLERVGIRIAEDGMLEVDKSVKFQEEMGQWSDPASYVEIN